MCRRRSLCSYTRRSVTGLPLSKGAIMSTADLTRPRPSRAPSAHGDMPGKGPERCSGQHRTTVIASALFRHSGGLGSTERRLLALRPTPISLAAQTQNRRPNYSRGRTRVEQVSRRGGQAHPQPPNKDQYARAGEDLSKLATGRRAAPARLQAGRGRLGTALPRYPPPAHGQVAAWFGRPRRGWGR